MKKVIIFLSTIILIVAVTDYTIGICCRYYIQSHELAGRYKPLDRLLKNVDTDIILIGNSVILNAINPQIISDSTSLTCYNGGITGKSIEFSEILINSILQRHTPKKIIIALRPEEMGANAGDGIFDVLKPYYDMGYKSIDEYFNSTSKSEKLLLQSNLLRYNTIWMRALLYIFFDNHDYSENGFVAQEIPAIFPQIQHITTYDLPIKRKTDALQRIIEKCKQGGIELYISFPPILLSFSKKELPCVHAVDSICKANSVKCFIDYNKEEFLHDPRLFYDNYHMNKNGAAKYTRNLVQRIQPSYKIDAPCQK
jgi:hypothetical protein